MDENDMLAVNGAEKSLPKTAKKKATRKAAKKAAKAAKRGESYSLNFRMSPSLVEAMDKAAQQLNTTRVEILRLGVNMLVKAKGLRAPEGLSLVRGRPSFIGRG
jgi:thiamine monophosphate kinase